MLSIAVCDDEAMECCHIAAKIKAVLEELKIPCMIQQFYNGQELLKSVENFDVIFLDIIMRGPNGMETAQLLRRKAFGNILVFISSSRDYVFDAYDVEAFQYLVKPVDENKLRQVLKRIIRKTEDHSSEFLIVSRERQNRKIFLDDIFYFEIMGRTVHVHGRNGVFTYYERIGILENNLREKGFFRCHKSYLVNLKHVDAYNRQEILLDNGERIVVAKRRYEAFCKEILAYMKRSGGML